MTSKAMSQEVLTGNIRKYARIALESLQVSRRLLQLLPARFAQLKREYTGSNKAAHAQRLALIDPRYQQAIDEYLKVMASALDARVRYETHSMLFEARRTLNKLARVRQKGG